MSNSTWQAQLPNPDTYLNHLAPDAATQFEIIKIINTAFLGALVWDILVFISGDVKIPRRGGGLATSACFLSTRFFATLYATLRVVITTREISNCRAITICANLACMLTMATSSFLFLRRAQAIYSESRLAHWGFTFMYVAATSCNVTLLFGITTKHIPGTGYCTTYKVELYATITYFMSGLFDTAVFFAISHKIAYQAHQNSGEGAAGDFRAARLFTSKTLPLLSQAILRGGQQYYLVGISTHLTALIVTFTPSVPPLYRTVFMPPSVVLMAIMVCHAHRHMASAFHNPNKDTSSFRTRAMTSIHFVHPQPVPGDIASRVVIQSLNDTVDPPSHKMKAMELPTSTV